ncbi:MAG: hydantoinase B/oxoprolinase family protein [Dehalococcoidia bacterium]|nr:hydantoinase B/oxoprolinase family protein [Dehalococcoidia bacterium]
MDPIVLPYHPRESLDFKPGTDYVTFEVLRHRLWQINDEQGRTIVNSSGSPVASDANDFNVGITTADGQVVAFGAYVFYHLAGISITIKNALRFFGKDGIRQGDLYLSNDPYVGGLHQNDCSVLGPVHWQGKMIAWTGSVLHHVDVGGPVAGSWTVTARDAFQESPRYRFLRIADREGACPEVMETALTNSRLPHLMEMDLRSQIAAANVAKERLYRLFQKYGAETVEQAMRDIIDYSDVCLRRKLLEIPDGEWYAEDYLDHNGHEDEIYSVKVVLRKRGDRLTLDFRGTAPNAPGFINTSIGGMLSGVFCGIAGFLCNDIPWNEGIFKCVEVISEEGTVNNARFPAAASMGAIGAGMSTANATAAALAKMLSCSEKHRKSVMGLWNASWLLYNISGATPDGRRFGAPILDPKAGGGGARTDRDGLDAGGNMSTPKPSISNVESLELQYPILYIYRKRAVDSGGPGKYRGGFSASSAFTPYGVDRMALVLATFGSDHSSAIGFWGGLPGGGSNGILCRNTDIWERIRSGRFPEDLRELAGEYTPMAPKALTDLRRGDVFEGIPHGGGGLGDPLDRDIALVQRDLADGYVSPEMARTVYGVELAPGGREVDQASTARRRKELLRERLHKGKKLSVGQAHRSATHQESGIRLPLGEALYVQSGRFHCAHCNRTLGGVRENPKLGCILIQAQLKEANPYMAMRWGGESQRFKLAEYACPGCGHLLFVDTRLNGEQGHWHDFKVWSWADR